MLLDHPRLNAGRTVRKYLAGELLVLLPRGVTFYINDAFFVLAETRKCNEVTTKNGSKNRSTAAQRREPGAKSNTDDSRGSPRLNSLRKRAARYIGEDTDEDVPRSTSKRSKTGLQNYLTYCKVIFIRKSRFLKMCYLGWLCIMCCTFICNR
jgi:hypothetical protein